jgi:hypothetical protein
LPYPNPSETQFGFNENVVHVSKEVRNLSDGMFFNLGQEFEDVEQTIRGVFPIVSKHLFLYIDKGWDKLLIQNPDIDRIVQALELLRKKYCSILNDVEKVTTSDIEESFKAVGMELKHITRAQINEQSKFMKDKIKEWKSEITPERMSELRMNRFKVGLMTYGISNLRGHLLKVFKR